MKQVSTIVLRAVIALIGLIVAAGCIFVLPLGILDPEAGAYRPILLGMYLPALPFFVALYQALKLLQYIDTGKAFSEPSVRSLKLIKYCGALIGGMYAIGLPYIFFVAEADDAPGVVLIGLLFTFAPLAVAVLAAVLQKFLQDAMDMKTENELTV